MFAGDGSTLPVVCYYVYMNNLYGMLVTTRAS